MRINSINIYNFRNYEKLFVNFDENINIFIGKNGSGKTNLLESIYFLAVTKSHRAYVEKSLINNDKDVMKITGQITTLDKTKKLEILMNQKGKMVSINDFPIRKVSEYISNFNVLLFCPDDLELVKGSPSERRTFLNLEIGQLDNKYLIYLNEYNKLIKNRNDYLKKIKPDNYDKNYFDVLNNQIVKNAIEIYRYRFLFLEALKTNLKTLYYDITKKNIEIKYKNSCDLKEFDSNSVKDILLNKLSNNIKKEIFQGNTLYGPHKDDFELYIDDINIREYGSQGQQRLSILCLKLSELEVFKSIKGEYPILLLDDVFSELDIEKRNRIVKILNKEVQVFITSTDIKNISRKIIKDAKIYKIEKGDVL